MNILPTNREVIEEKLLTALEGPNVAVLLSEPDLRMFLTLLDDALDDPDLDESEEKNMKDFQDAFSQLLRSAFPSNAT